jgi:uncharacterized protein HemY
LGNVLFEQGDYANARALLTESLALKRELGDKWGMAAVLSNLGSVALAEDDIDSARRVLLESLGLRRELGDRWSLADSLEGLAFLAVAEAEPERAATLWGAAEAIRACHWHSAGGGGM